MDSFMGFSSPETEEEERLYCSAPQNEEDIIWAGSDTEESAEEIVRKRRRYEYHAQRYLRGQLPLLQSASLKGPFAKDWVNPWRYRQRKKVPHWWKPGSKDMLFTRANVMKRAADYGMGHLKPDDALAWCKAEAEAEAKTKMDQQEGSIERASAYSESNEESEAQSDMEGQYTLPSLDLQNDGSGDTRMDVPTKPAFPTDRFSIPRTNMEMLNEGPNSGSRNLKRPADSQWLKASSFAKVAKWDAPAMSSPTPIPDFHIQRNQRGEQSSSRPPTLRNQAPSMSNPTTLLFNEAQTVEPLDSFSESTTRGDLHLSNLIKMRSFTSSPHSNGQQYANGRGTDSYPGEKLPYPDSQETAFVSPETHFEKRKLNNKPSTSRNPYLSTIEPRDLLSPAVARSLIAMKGTAQRDTSKAIRSPTLPRPYAGSNPGSPEDTSFITEIAPSSRDLEQFRYRKKRRRSSRQESTESDERLHDQTEMISQVSPESMTPTPDEGSDIAAETLHEQVEKSPSDSQISGAEAESSTDMPQSQFKPPPGPAEDSAPMLPSETAALPAEDVGEGNDSPSSRYSDSSWDMIDIIDARKINFTARGLENAEVVPPESSLDHGPENELSFSADKQPLDQKNRSSQPESVVICPAHLSSSSNKVPGDLTARTTVESFYVPNPVDESTQSYNSTPMSTSQSLQERTPASIKHLQKMHVAIEVEEFPNARTPLAQYSQIIAANSVTSVEPDELCLGEAQPQKNEMLEATDETTASHQHRLDPMQIIQNALSQDCDISSQTSSQSTSNDPYISPHNAFKNETGGVQSNAPGGNENPHSPQDEGQASWQQGATQSPWTTAMIDPATIQIPRKSIESERFDTPESEESEPEDFVQTGTSPERDGGVDDSDWQRLDLPCKSPEYDVIKPFQDFITPTPSPEPSVPGPSEGDLPNTQLLLEAVVNNPWASSFRNPASGKSRKRVSFGGFPSEELENSQMEVASSKPLLGSPLLLCSAEPRHKVHGFEDGTETVNRLEKHFMTTAGVKRILSETSNSQFHERSPAIGAMAEAFIAADRDTSAERGYPHISQESPSRHLKPIRQARAGINTFNTSLSPPKHSHPRHQGIDNVANPRSIDCDIGDDDLDDFIGGAGDLLEEWSVEAELKKAEPAKSTKSSSDSGRRRSIFGLTDRW